MKDNSPRSSYKSLVSEALSPISARLTAETTSRGKLRDRLLRKALSKARHDKVRFVEEVLDVVVFQRLKEMLFYSYR